MATRSGGVSVDAGNVIQALGDASASLTMKMAKQNSAALILDNVGTTYFRDERIIRLLMETMLAKGFIEVDEVVVTYVRRAQSGIVAASSEKATAIEGEAGADLGLTEFKLGKVKGKLSIVQGQTSDTIVEGEQGRPLTPMYRALFFRASWPSAQSSNETIYHARLKVPGSSGCRRSLCGHGDAELVRNATCPG
jgi:hypothetical protein